MPASAEWSLVPSQQQRWLDAFALLLFCVLLLALLPWALWLVIALVVLVAKLLWAVRARTAANIRRIGYRDDHLARQWWLQGAADKRPVQWQAGSIRRQHCVVLRWSFWPWDRMVLRRDCFVSDDEFRRFRAALYGAI